MSQSHRAALIGSRLREMRLAAGLRQGELAQSAGISASYLNLIEHDRRNVTAEVMARLSQALGQDLGRLLERSPQLLMEELRNAAARLPQAAPELDRVEDFARRFPGWAGLIAALQGEALALEQVVAALNDRLGHDPHLSAALHELLTALSAVRSTASILVETEDISAEWQRRFHLNLYQDSERLVQGAEALVNWLDHSEAQPEPGRLAAAQQVEHWLSARDWQLPEIETGDLAALEQQTAVLATPEARDLALRQLAEMLGDARAMPMAAFRPAAQRLDDDPALLAAEFGVPILAVMRRLAMAPGSQYGFVRADAAGSLLFRKPLAGFSLPRFGAACPLWPLFSALARPGLCLEQRLEMPAPGGGVFRGLAYATVQYPQGFSGPELREAAMLIVPVRPAAGAMPVLAIGSTCRICPRDACAARRETSILTPL